MHARRYNFTRRLKSEIPELEIFGHGIRHIEKKHKALDPYRFHPTIENHRAPDIWTEQPADAFLGCTVPIYCGCPNVFDYFPEDNLIPIDIDHVEQSIHTIQTDRRCDSSLDIISYQQCIHASFLRTVIRRTLLPIRKHLHYQIVI